MVEEQAEAIIGAAYEAGINLFDLSDAHSGEKCEIELGKILKKREWKRSSYIIVTKIYWSSRYVSFSAVFEIFLDLLSKLAN